MAPYDPATEGETGRRPDRRGALRRRRGLPSCTRPRRLRRGLEQPVGASDEGPARLRLLRGARRSRRLPAVRPRRLERSRRATTSGWSSIRPSTRTSRRSSMRSRPNGRAEATGLSGRPGRRPPRRRLSVPGLLGRQDPSPGARTRREEGRPVVGESTDCFGSSSRPAGRSDTCSSRTSTA